MSRPSIVIQFLALALVIVVVARFSTGSSSDTIVYDQARDLQQTVSQAIAATNDAVIGAGSPQLAAEAIDRASSASRQLAENRARAESAQLRSLATQTVSAADQIVAQLSRGAVARAEELRTERLVPLASEMARLKGSQPAATQTPGSNGTMILIGSAIALVVAGSAVLFRQRHRNAGGSADTMPHGRKRDEANPFYDDQVRNEPTVSESADIARTTRMRPIDIDLQSLLASTIEQARERDWTVSLVCPEVRISGDPVRVQRAILAALGNAFLEGAELVGIVVDVVDGQVLVSIGHDAPIDDQKAESIATRLADQLAAALDEPELGWSVAADGEIYLTTIAAAQRVTHTGAEIPV